MKNAQMDDMINKDIGKFTRLDHAKLQGYINFFEDFTSIPDTLTRMKLRA